MVPVNKTTGLFAVFKAVSVAPISPSASAQEIAFPPLVGSFKRRLSSYNDNTEACTLAFVVPFASLFGMIWMGRPSLVFTKTFAKSYPSATVVANQSATPGIISFGFTT